LEDLLYLGRAVLGKVDRTSAKWTFVAKSSGADVEFFPLRYNILSPLIWSR